LPAPRPLAVNAQTLGDLVDAAHRHVVTFRYGWDYLPERDKDVSVVYSDPNGVTLDARRACLALMHGYRIVRFDWASSSVIYLMPPRHWLFRPAARVASHVWTNFFAAGHVPDHELVAAVRDHSAACGVSPLLFVEDWLVRPRQPSVLAAKACFLKDKAHFSNIEHKVCMAWLFR